jgi:hypothetical protein
LELGRNIISKYGIENKKQNVDGKNQNFLKYNFDSIEEHKKAKVCKK